MIVAGTLTNKMAPALRKVYDQMRSQGMLYQWVHVQMVVGIITTHIQSLGVRSNCASGCVCSWLPSNRRGSSIRDNGVTA